METLDEFQSITTGFGKSSILKYQTYYDLLINACVRYDRTKKANIAKRGYIYHTTFTPNNDGFIDQLPSETPDRDPYMGILIHPVMNSILSILINLVHLSLLDIDFNPDFPDLTQIQNQIHFQTNQPDKNRLVLYTCQDIFTNF